MLIKELGVDEVALLGALRKQTRVQLIDPGEIVIDPDALRMIPRDVCARLRVLPLEVHSEGTTKVLRVAMADPTDTSAVAEVEQLTQFEIEISALPLSAIDELVDKGYRQINTVVNRPSGTMFITSRGAIPRNLDVDSEVSVTAQLPISAIHPAARTEDLEARLAALVHVLTAKGLITEAELADALQKSKPGSGA
jgi:hypothetical protein